MTKEEAEKKIKRIFIKIAWAFFTLLMLLSLGLLFSGSFLAAASVFLAAVFLAPISQEEINKNSKNEMRVEHRLTAGSICLLVGFIASPSCGDTFSKEAAGDADDKAEPRVYYESQLKTLKEIGSLSPDRARNIATGFAMHVGADERYYDSFYRCLGDYVRTKSDDLSLEKVMDWCRMDFERDAEAFKRQQDAYSFFDLKRQFSGWDGSHIKSVAAIKRAMHDASSFKHVETMSRLSRDGDAMWLMVTTRFRGTNAFGGVVTSTARTTVDPNRGAVIDLEFD